MLTLPRKKKRFRRLSGQSATSQPLARSLPDVAAVAGFKADSPSRLSVMACPTEFPGCDSVHGDIVRTPLHLKDGVMTGVALVPDTVEPMRKDSERGSSFPTFSLEDDVPLDSQGCAC
jgi:hypothetical protein